MYDFLLVFYSDYAVHRFRDTTSSLAQSGKFYTPFSSFIYKRLPIAYIVSCRKNRNNDRDHKCRLYNATAPYSLSYGVVD